MKRILSSNLLTLLTCAVSLAAGVTSSPATAQSATVRTCNAVGSVTIAVLGVPLTDDLPCVNETEVTAPGQDESAPVSNTTLGVSEIGNLVTVEAPFGAVGWTQLDDASPVTYSAHAGAAKLSLLQNGVQTDDVAAGFLCTATANNTLIDCKGGMTIGDLHVMQLPVQLPPQPIPPNTEVPIVDVPLEVAPLGMPVLGVPLRSRLLLNKVTMRGEGTSTASLEQAAIALEASGVVRLFGTELVRVDLDIKDYSELTLVNGPSMPISIVIGGRPYTELFGTSP